MKILCSSYAYSPGIGGIEAVSQLLVREFSRIGHEVTVVTETEGEPARGVVRRPTLRDLRKLLRESDVVFQNNISLRHLIPALVMGKPVALLHQTWIAGPDGIEKWNDRLKLLLAPRLKNFAISRALSSKLPFPCEIIGNPYDDEMFFVREGMKRSPHSILFVGRLVSDKGADDLLHALMKMPAETTLTIAGDGPERDRLQMLGDNFNLSRRVKFVGAQAAVDIAQLMNQHRVLAVPSKWSEPFGVVALEGIACGCAVVGSEQGGLPEAIGPCGRLFPNGNVDALAEALRHCLESGQNERELRAATVEHLTKFRPAAIAARILQELESMR